MRKNRIFWLLAVILLTAIFPFTAKAAGTVELASVSGVRGETTAVTVQLKSDDVCAGNFSICYDEKELSLVSINTETFSSGYCLANQMSKGTVRVNFVSSMEPLKDQLLCTLFFRITADTPTDGSALTLKELRLYNEFGEQTEASVTAGIVARKTAHLSLDSAKVAKQQAVGIKVRLEGGLPVAGGEFAFRYDPSCFEVGSVKVLDGLGGAVMSWRADNAAGMLRVSFGAAKAVPAGELCSIILQTISKEEKDTAIQLVDAKVYDEDADSLDVMVSGGTLRVTAPSNRTPKLWIVGGALENGRAKIGVVLQGRGKTCGGYCKLRFDASMEAHIEANSAGCVVNQETEAGLIEISWGAALPHDGEQELLVVTFDNVLEGTPIELESVQLYDEDGDRISCVELRSAVFGSMRDITSSLDVKRCAVDETGKSKKYTVAVDVADMRYFSRKKAERIFPVLALYQGAQLEVLSIQTDEVLMNAGVCELLLSAESKEKITSARVFLLDAKQTFLPLGEALSLFISQDL